MITGFVLSVFLNGASFSFTDAAYVVNHSSSTIYYKPESLKANPGLDQDAAYAIAPGESLYTPVDAVVTAITEGGKVYRVPTGGKIIINEEGKPEPSGIIAKIGSCLPAYGNVEPPCEGFAMLANSKHILTAMPDIIASLN